MTRRFESRYEEEKEEKKKKIGEEECGARGRMAALSAAATTTTTGVKILCPLPEKIEFADANLFDPFWRKRKRQRRGDEDAPRRKKEVPGFARMAVERESVRGTREASSFAEEI